LITLGKRATLHSRRHVFSLLTDKAATDKVFETLAGRFAGREGGYTRIVRTGYRVGDGAEMAIIEYLPVEEKKAGAKKKKASAKKPPAKPAGKKKDTKDTSRPSGRKAKEPAPKETKSRATRTKTQKTPEGGQG
jgi:large subunit ribosomal protein L17